MAKVKYQIEDFFAKTNDECKNFVMAVNEMLLQNDYRQKLEITKSNGFQLSYFQRKIKTTAGRILAFLFQGEKFMIRIEIKNHMKYPELLNNLPRSIVSQIDYATNCIKFSDPQKCWKGCGGYDFYIKEKRYQKCIVNCIQVEVNPECTQHLLELIKSESKERYIK